MNISLKRKMYINTKIVCKTKKLLICTISSYLEMLFFSWLLFFPSLSVNFSCFSSSFYPSENFCSLSFSFLKVFHLSSLKYLWNYGVLMDRLLIKRKSGTKIFASFLLNTQMMRKCFASFLLKISLMRKCFASFYWTYL